MSKQTIQTLCAGVACLVLLACAQQRVRVLTDDPMVMLRTQSSFTIRSNPCGCIVNRQALDYEIKLGSQWRRVFVEPEQANAQALEGLKSFFLKHPRGHHKIEARFLEVFYQWLPGHHAPGMAIDRISVSTDLEHASPRKTVESI
jgi:hypothetical protein